MNAKLSLTLIAAALVATTVIAAQPAFARERQATVVGGNGKSAIRDVSRSHGDVASSTTAANGRALGSRQVDRSPTSTTGSVTGPQGGTTTRDTARKGSGSTTTVTGPNGQTGNVEVTR